MVARRIIAGGLIAALVVVAGGFDRGSYGGSQWASRQGGYYARPKGAHEKWFPPPAAEEFAAVESGAIYYATTKYFVAMNLPAGCTAAVTVRIRNHNTLATIGTNKITPDANPAITATGWTITTGTPIDIHYTADTSTAGFKDVTGWTALLTNWEATPDGFSLYPEPPTE